MLSLLICTRNRARQLERTLQHVGALVYDGEWEVIVVDNGSTDDTRVVVESFGRAVPVPVRYLVAPHPGLSHARNAGVACARGEILCFTDDDCYPATDYLQRIEEIFERHPDAAYVGGRVLLYDPEDARITLQESLQARVFRSGAVLEAGVIHGANMAMRREALSSIGAFDPLLGAGGPLRCGEDTDILVRLAAAGFTGRYDPAPVVYHHHMRRRGPEITAQKRGHDVGRGAVYFKALLRPATRRTYAVFWLRRLRRLPPGKALRELYGAALYCLYFARARMTRSTTASSATAVSLPPA